MSFIFHRLFYRCSNVSNERFIIFLGKLAKQRYKIPSRKTKFSLSREISLPCDWRQCPLFLSYIILFDVQTFQTKLLEQLSESSSIITRQNTKFLLPSLSISFYLFLSLSLSFSSKQIHFSAARVRETSEASRNLSQTRDN